jgi:hypothetical protein
MTDDNDLALRALFGVAQHEDAGLSPSAFTAGVAARVGQHQAMREALTNSLMLAGCVCVAVAALVLLPTLGPALSVPLAKSTAFSSITPQSIGSVALVLMSAIGWAVGIRD